MNLQLLSKYRGVNMGVAILLVVLFHVYVARHNPFFGLHRLGNVGVDIFLFLSGMGLWFSWSKKQDYLQFYKNRFKRIYPTWILIAGIYYGMRFDGVHWTDLCGDVLINWDFWLHDELTFWYMPAIMALYIVAPFYMELIRRHPIYRWLVALMIVWTFAVQWVGPIHQTVGHIEIFWSRVPIFFIGINMGEMVRKGVEIEKSAVVLILLTFVSTFALSLYLEQAIHGRFPLFIERLVYIPMTVTSLMLLSLMFEKTNKRILSVLAWIGGISLEIYLIHAHFVLKYVQAYHLGYWLTALITILITIPLAWGLQFIIKKIIR